jgi:hypothetical protein
MLSPFLRLAVQSPTRQRALRRAVVGHVVFVAAAGWFVLDRGTAAGAVLFGHLLLCAGIVEGAVLLGWRMSQLPKSQALEFLLVTALQPRRVFLGEAVVGLVRLAVVTAAGLPVLTLLLVAGRLEPRDVGLLLLMPFTWGAVTGLGLACWAYEPARVRKWGERVCIGGIIAYLAVGVLAGENLRAWIGRLPEGVGELLMFGFEAFHRYNPFGTWQFWVEYEPALSGERAFWVTAAATTAAGLFLVRSAWRLHGHFHDLHYRPIADAGKQRRPPVGDRPLSWWAVRRVTQYSGRVNIWLAGGFGLLYALYTVAGPYWPAWMGRRVFVIFDQMGGIPAVAAALVVLAAVPAAFQYGLWDSNAQDRCRRLELLLLTELRGRDYWSAAAAAAWKRGRGYFLVAGVLWLAAVVSGRIPAWLGVAALTAGGLLWALYFALGFRAFSRGMQANGLGVGLTLGLPLVAVALARGGWPTLAALLPPGGVYFPGSGSLPATWLAGTVLCGVATLGLARLSLARCDAELRNWYDLNHGRKVVD